MSALKLASNRDLADYLQRLSTTLRAIGQLDAADALLHSNRFISGSPSEFLHEAWKALRAVAHAPDVLDAAQAADVKYAIDEIDKAFARVGGA